MIRGKFSTVYYLPIALKRLLGKNSFSLDVLINQANSISPSSTFVLKREINTHVTSLHFIIFDTLSQEKKAGLSIISICVSKVIQTYSNALCVCLIELIFNMVNKLWILLFFYESAMKQS